ncbi:MAG: T9SS type A sorting domain-containing protein [Sphingobacteriaceae bacterium]|nr:T9SS type A sorting domain-containing protein [Sphingobacteriaceae bacterium]
MTTYNNHQVEILLRDMNGKLVYNSNFNIHDNAKLQIIPENKLASGIYFCSLLLEEIEYKVKVVVH